MNGEALRLATIGNHDERRCDLDLTGRSRSDKLQPWVVDKLIEGRQTDQHLVNGTLHAQLASPTTTHSVRSESTTPVSTSEQKGVPIMTRAAMSAAGDWDPQPSEGADLNTKTAGPPNGARRDREGGFEVGWVPAGAKEKKEELCWRPRKRDKRRMKYKSAAHVFGMRATSTGALSSSFKSVEPGTRENDTLLYPGPYSSTCDWGAPGAGRRGLDQQKTIAYRQTGSWLGQDPQRDPTTPSPGKIGANAKGTTAPLADSGLSGSGGNGSEERQRAGQGDEQGLESVRVPTIRRGSNFDSTVVVPWSVGGLSCTENVATPPPSKHVEVQAGHRRCGTCSFAKIPTTQPVCPMCGRDSRDDPVRHNVDAVVRAVGKTIAMLGGKRRTQIPLPANSPTAVKPDRYWTQSWLEACRNGDLEVLDRGLKLHGGGAINLVDGAGRHGMHYAAAAGKSNVAKWFLDRGIAANVKERGTLKTPMHFAARNGSKAVALLLLEPRGSQRLVNERDKNGATPVAPLRCWPATGSLPFRALCTHTHARAHTLPSTAARSLLAAGVPDDRGPHSKRSRRPRKGQSRLQRHRARIAWQP